MADVYNSQLEAFSLYQKLQEPTSPSAPNGPGLPALGHALAGSAGTAISNLAIYPLDLVITRLQVQRSLRRSLTIPEEGEYKGVLDAFEQIYEKEGGLLAFYTGILQDTGKSITDSFLFFLFYNYLRTNRLQKHGKKTTTLPVLDELAVGVFAGACSKFFTTPISNIVTRKQTAFMISTRSKSPTAESTVADMARAIRSQKGIQGFWSGYSASLVLTLNPSITFFLYEFFKRFFLPRSRRDDPGARIIFLMAAVSKAIASTITYPFSLAKARAQTSSSPPVDPASAEEVKQEVETAKNKSEARKAGKDAESVAKKSTIFHTILEIYKTEGAEALYEGVLGEILKGFFSHGLTMIVKESIHKLIIQAYYIILKALNKYPSPTELANQAGGRIQEVGEKASEVVKDGYENVLGEVSTLLKGGKGVTEQARSGVAAIVEKGKESFGNAIEGTRSTGESGKKLFNQAVGKANVIVDGGKAATGHVVAKTGNNATEATQAANNYASKEGGHLLGNAQEMLGGKLEDLGEGLKPAKDE